MENNTKITSPKYQQIAIDIASKIVEKHYHIGEKIYARSSIASRYSVSSETARRAICILSDLDIVETTKGSGVVIKSYENAVQFVRQHKDIQSIHYLKNEIFDSIERQNKEAKYFNKCITELIDKMDRFRYSNPFTPSEIEITADTPYLNKSIADVNFWHNTSATIVGIKRNNTLLLSPGPYAIINEGDVFYFVGDENCLQRVHNFIYPENK